MSALLKDERPDVRRAAAEAIEKALPYRARVPQQLIDLVRVAVGDEDPTVRKSADALSRHISHG